MAQTTELRTAVRDFYEQLAPDYDVMTGFGQRFLREKPFFHFLIERYDIKTALDAGCGTGFHSMLLSQLGVTVTAVDISGAMVERLSARIRNTGILNITPVESAIEDYEPADGRRFDAVFCLGNTIPHILEEQELLRVFEKFAVLLNPGGILFTQLLNFGKVMRSGTRLQQVRDEGDNTYIRFFDLEGPTVRFNILTLKRGANGVHQHLNSVELRPWALEDILPLLEKAGFPEVRSFGSISMDEFAPETSHDLVILATRAR
jgi:SAM-dependent methyltransferase